MTRAGKTVTVTQSLDNAASGIQANAQFLLDYLAGAGSPTGPLPRPEDSP